MFRGTPQIEVTFQVDTNGILQVTAEDKAAKNKQTITITNERDRLSEDEIKRMVEEAELYAKEDKRVRERVEARNKLESYVYNMKSTIGDNEKLAGAIDEDEKQEVERALKGTTEWLDENPAAEKNELEEKLKEVEAVCTPVIKKAYEKGAASKSADEEEDDDDHDEL